MMPNNNMQMQQQNPQMMPNNNMQMQQQMMPNNNMQSQSQNDNIPMSDAELQQKMNNMMSERSQDTHTVQKNSNFNPMVSPNMNSNLTNMINNNDMNQLLMMQKANDVSNNNYLNYNGGKSYINMTREGNYEQLNNDELTDKINLVKRDILQNKINQNNLLLNKSIFDMDSKNIGMIIQKMETNTNNTNEVNEVLEPKDKKLKKTNKQKNNALHKLLSSVKEHNKTIKGVEIETVSNDNVIKEDDESIIVHVGTKHKSDKHKPSLREIAETDVTDKKLENELSDLEESSQIVPNNINKEIFQHTYNLTVNSEEHSDAEFYNDYYVKLDKVYKNVKCIILESFKVPSFSTQVKLTNENNTFSFQVENGEILDIDFDEGEYTLNDIITSINYGFDELNTNMEIGITKGNNVYIKHKNEIKFSLLNVSKGLCKYLGFDKDKKGKYKYVSTNEISLLNNTILFLHLDSLTEKPFVLDLKNNKSSKQEFDIPIKVLSDLVIKFSYTNESSDSYIVDFKENPHILNFAITT